MTTRMAILVASAGFLFAAAGGCRLESLAGGGPSAREGRHELAAEGLGTEAWRNVYEPGQVAAMHEHSRPRYVVVVSGGILRATLPDGSTRRLELKTGQVVVRPAERHALENVGRTRVEVIEIEIP